MAEDREDDITEGDLLAFIAQDLLDNYPAPLDQAAGEVTTQVLLKYYLDNGLDCNGNEPTLRLMRGLLDRGVRDGRYKQVGKRICPITGKWATAWVKCK